MELTAEKQRTFNLKMSRRDRRKAARDSWTQMELWNHETYQHLSRQEARQKSWEDYWTAYWRHDPGKPLLDLSSYEPQVTKKSSVFRRLINRVVERFRGLSR